MWIASSAMGLQYALLYACVVATMVWPTTERWAPSFYWTKNMTIKNPENNPAFNYAELGPLQDAWQVLEETSKNTYFLMFRTDNSVYDRCVYATAKITDKRNKTANYTITFYRLDSQKYVNTTVQVRALSQTDYPLENVIRTNLKGTVPSATPVPPGSYTYTQYDNSTCYTRGTPFPDMGVAARPQPSTQKSGSTENNLDEMFVYKDNPDYMDTFLVYNQPQCYVLRSPAANRGCDLWLRKTELKSIVDDRKEDILQKEKELKDQYKKKYRIYDNCTATQKQKADLNFKVNKEMGQWFQDVVWKRISPDCVLAFMITCGYPTFWVYGPAVCNSTLTGQ